jgi:hypothetical protein
VEKLFVKRKLKDGEEKNEKIYEETNEEQQSI